MNATMNATMTRDGRELTADVPELTDDIIEGLEQALAMYQRHIEEQERANGFSLDYSRPLPGPVQRHRDAWTWLRTVGHRMHLAEVAAEEADEA